jgi:hypothetical protein
MPLANAVLDLGAGAIRTAITHLSLSTASPEPTGTNQATSGRVAATWGAVTAGTGDFALSGTAAFTGGAANGPVHSVCFWSASSGGTYYGSQALTGDPTFNSAGEYTVTAITVNGSST